MKLKPLSPNEDKTNEVFASEDCQQLLKMYDEFYPKFGFHMPWVGYVIERNNEIVGTCGFVGKPVKAKVEIAYWTFKAFECQGIGSFACKELVAIAHQANPNLTITAKTAPENNASTKILEKNHFVFSEIVQDEEIGDAWLWIYKK